MAVAPAAWLLPCALLCSIFSLTIASSPAGEQSSNVCMLAMVPAINKEAIRYRKESHTFKALLLIQQHIQAVLLATQPLHHTSWLSRSSLVRVCMLQVSKVQHTSLVAPSWKEAGTAVSLGSQELSPSVLDAEGDALATRFTRFDAATASVSGRLSGRGCTGGVIAAPRAVNAAGGGGAPAPLSSARPFSAVLRTCL